MPTCCCQKRLICCPQRLQLRQVLHRPLNHLVDTFKQCYVFIRILGQGKTMIHEEVVIASGAIAPEYLQQQQQW